MYNSAAMNRRFVLVVCALTSFLALACSGDHYVSPKPSATEDSSIQLDGSSSSFRAGTSIDTVTGAGGNALTGSSSLPGLTVVGYGDATAKPDEAIVRLTIGQGEVGFSTSDSPRLQLIDEAELKPVTEALKKQGIDDKTIEVNTLVSSPYGLGQGSAQITFRWGKPDDMKSILDLAGNTVRQNTNQGLQNITVLFTVKDCEPLEQQSWSAALDDAKNRAERLAKIAGLQLGNIVAISESPGPASLYGVASGCAALEELPATDLASASFSKNSATQVEVDTSLQVTFALK